jgi:hypothetical protein
MTDISIIYYTSNTIPDIVARNIRRHTLEVTEGKIPIVSVSQKPIDFGTNICVGEIGQSYYNMHKQALIAAMAVKTKYLAVCDDDTLYTKEYFTHRPSTDDTFAYNLNWWYAESTRFWHKRPGVRDTGMCQCICPTKELIENYQARFDHFPPLDQDQDKSAQRRWMEPGRDDEYFGIPNAKVEYFKSKIPTIVFNYRYSLGGRRKSWHGRTLVDSLPVWGKATDLWHEYWEGSV